MTIRLLSNIYTHCPVNWNFAADLCLGRPKHRLYHDYTFRRPWDGVVTTGVPRRNRYNRCLVTGCSGGRANTTAATNTPTQTQSDGSDLPYTGSPTIVNVDDQGGKVTMRTQQARHAVHPIDTMGGPVEFPRVWAFQADDNAPSVPGPILRTTEGNAMEVTLDNTGGRRAHTIHFHGVRKTWKNDGVPTTTGIKIPPGEKHTYEIPANVPGTHFYHCHFQTHRHIDMGMYGIYRVDPEGYESADREYFMTIKDWDSRVPRKWAGETDFTYNSASRNPDVFTVNGKSTPRTLHPEKGSPIIVDEGDTVRVHLVNGGYMSHPMHIHNHRFQRVEKDGGTIPEAARHDMNTDILHGRISSSTRIRPISTSRSLVPASR